MCYIAHEIYKPIMRCVRTLYSFSSCQQCESRVSFSSSSLKTEEHICRERLCGLVKVGQWETKNDQEEKMTTRALRLDKAHILIFRQANASTNNLGSYFISVYCFLYPLLPLQWYYCFSIDLFSFELI